MVWQSIGENGMWNATVYQQFIREGRGQGSGMEYKPWVAIQDFASRGMVSHVKGQTTGRLLCKRIAHTDKQ